MKKILCIAGLLIASTLCLKAQDSQEDIVAKYDAALLKAGVQAPDFKLETPDGKTLSLNDFKGKYLVLDFWAVWCPDCIKDLPEMKKAYDRFKSAGVEFLAVSLDDNKENWIKAIDQYDLNYLHGTEYKKWRRTDIAPAYKIDWIPTIYIIDKKGKVVLGTIDSGKAIQKLSEITGK